MAPSVVPNKRDRKDCEMKEKTPLPGFFRPAPFRPAPFRSPTETPEQRLLGAVRSIEDAQEQMKQARIRIDIITQYNPKLKKQWNKFLELGGVTSNELERHLNKKSWRYRRNAVRNKHLRLVSVKPPVRLKLIDDDDDVA
jgi:hypothetical protein